MTDIDHLLRELVARILDGSGHAPPELRRAAFGNAGLPDPLGPLIDKVAHHAYRVTDEDVASVLSAGFTEDQIFELTICAAVGQATRQYGSGRAALEAAGRS